MIGIGRRTGVAALMGSLLLGALSGCVNTGDNSGPNFAAQTPSANPGCARCQDGALLGNLAGDPAANAKPADDVRFANGRFPCRRRTQRARGEGPRQSLETTSRSPPVL